MQPGHLKSLRSRAALCRAFLALLVTTSAAFGQSSHPAAQSAVLPAFEEASIKPCQKGSSAVHSSAGRLTESCVTLELLIRDAYCRFVNGEWQRNPVTGAVIPPMPPWQMTLPVAGTIGWMKSQLFTINAKSDSPASREMMQGPMMRALLEDRFRLKIHHEKREMKISLLTVAAGGPKLLLHRQATCIALDPKGPPPSRKPGDLTPVHICGSVSRSPRGGVDIIGATTVDLCTLLSAGDRRVVDGSGLTATYDIHLDVTLEEYLALARPPGPGINEEASDPGGTLIASLKRVGLKLQSTKTTVDTLVIDRAQRPTEN